MNGTRSTLLACAAALAVSAVPASASVDEYSVAGNSSVTITLNVCSAESQLAVRGDTGTDLDFVVRTAAGDAIHSDAGVDDYLSVVIESAVVAGAEGEEETCEAQQLEVSNLGEEENTFTIVLEPITEGSIRIEKYIVQANSTQTVNFKACGTDAEVSVRGDGDTDLDFVIRNADGAVVHENDDMSDETTATLPGLLSDCEVFELDIANLGNVYNAAMVVVEPKGTTEPAFAGTAPTTSLASSGMSATQRTSSTAEESGAGEYRVDANATLNVNLPACGETRLEVRGDGDTDLDFTVTNSDGETVHSDSDLSDITFTTLAADDGCETYSIAVDNLGDVYNVFTIALSDANTPRGVEGPGEYRVNANSATKVALRVCEVTQVSARGDGDTDLDFAVTDASGSSIHSDYDLTDKTDFTLDPGEDCADFQMEVENLGDVYNVMTVAFGGDAVATSSAATATPGATLSTARPVIQSFDPASMSSDGNSRAIAILNRTGEEIRTVYWANSATLEMGDNRLGDGNVLADAEQWDVDMFDGSNACIFNVRAVTESYRLIEHSDLNICDETLLVLE